jgi:hypothetical protein
LPSLIFARRLQPYLRTLGWKGLPGTNALVYYEKAQLTAVKFYNIGPWKLNRLFVSVKLEARKRKWEEEVESEQARAITEGFQGPRTQNFLGCNLQFVANKLLRLRLCE